MLPHKDSMFLPTPALINILTAKAVPPSGGPTELASTLAAWADIPDQLKIRRRMPLSGTGCLIPDQRFQPIWPNCQK